MGKSAKALRSLLEGVHIYNTHLLAGVGGVFIEYWAHGPYRAASWRVYKPGFRIRQESVHTPSTRYRQFLVFNRAGKAISLEEAQQWAAEEFGIAEWAKTPFGSYMDKEVLEKRMVELFEAGDDDL